ncbi:MULTISPECIES: stage II sporulation protein R [Lysinibacillus]|jgi:stage II sporulation protein R|uniref:stage II sporulation protein R n=1 Tax=Lysinibacillus TaxID=400634 RepID=UPI0004D40F70|nr:MULTISPECIES: stage II sporulation protein R [Lysinibacillus]AJK89449.1 stage II sporulation protein R [Lysinibacillus fusiformis]KAB0441248.1 stage II sporulation protein R [Lysinibacillus fusiformis]KEK11973.1 stage II sporulation protein R [Lysinibacillus sphaericus]KGA85097.1 stage II sporulation protein R [Lysinibacillus fusiformis]KHK51277.1 stage II sporulation protein R [Lysinibacillus sp. A1]
MLNEYKFIRLPKQNIFLAFARLVVVAIALQLCVLYIPSLVGFAKEATNQEQENDFRIRVIANSNTAQDQYEKEQLVEELKPYFMQVVTAGVAGNEQIQTLKQQIETELSENYPQIDTQVVVGDNLFPPKRQGAVLYPQNVYHSIVVKIGDARGDNWWCSIFPSICEPEKEEVKAEEPEEEEQVTFFIWEWVKGLFA